MEKELEKLFKNTGKTTVVILIYGVLVREKAIYIAMTLGSLISMLSLYLLYRDAEFIMHAKNNPMRNTLLGYGKRYLIYGIFLWAMIYVDFRWFVGGMLGLLTVKFNILFKMISIHLKYIKEKLKKNKERR